jgi:hypothetical protein
MAVIAAIAGIAELGKQNLTADDADRNEKIGNIAVIADIAVIGRAKPQNALMTVFSFPAHAGI